MLVKPSKLKTTRLFRNVTLRSETLNKTHGNIYACLSYDLDEMADVIKSKLFRPSELMAYYTPRIVKPLKRQIVRTGQKDIYKKIKQKTNNVIKITKVDLEALNGRNVMIDVMPEFNYSREWLEQNRTIKFTTERLYPMMTGLYDDLFSKFSKMDLYEKKYLIIPFSKHFQPAEFEKLLKRKVFTLDDFIKDPILMILGDIRKGNIDKLKNFDRVFIYNPIARLIMSIDPRNTTDKELTLINARIRRLNAFNKNMDEGELHDESDPDGITSDVELDEDDEIETAKEKVKEEVYSRISNKLKINLVDYESATQDEQELRNVIDIDIEKFIDEAPVDSTLDDMIDTVIKDKQVTSSTARYLNLKLQNEQMMKKQSELNDTEVDLLSNILDELDDAELDSTVVRPMSLDLPGNVDPRLQTSTTYNFDSEYNKKFSKKDLLNVFSSFSGNEHDPMTMVKFDKEDTSDDRTSKETYAISLRSPSDRRDINFKIDIPKFVDESYFYINGNMKSMNKQLTRLPLVKTKEDQVELTTNYNKITFSRTPGKISRRNEKILKLLEKIENKPIKVLHGVNSIDNNEFKSNYEFEELGASLFKIETPIFDIFFNRKNTLDIYSMLNVPDDLIQNKQTPIGFRKQNDSYSSLIYIDDDQNGKIFEFSINDQKSNEISMSLFEFIVSDILGMGLDDRMPQIGKAFVYTRMKFLGKTYPLFVVLGMMLGLTTVLKKYKIEHTFDNKPSKHHDFISIKFKDGYLNYRDEIRNSILLNILYRMNTEDYNFSAFDTYDPYKEYIARENGSVLANHTKRGLRINLSCMIDPMTRDVLLDNNLPIDMMDIILLVNTMLTTNVCRDPMDMRNFRIRGNEAVYGLLYQILASEYRKYQEYKSRNVGMNSSLKFNVPRNILIAKLMELNNFNDISVLNPVLEALNTATVSPVGHRGINLSQAYTLNMRVHNESQMGVTSANSTSYSDPGKARALVYNSRVIHPRGYIDVIDNVNQIGPTEVLAIGDLLSYRNSVSADPPRVAMQIGQTKHLVQTKKSHKMLLGSGANRTLPYLLSGQFVFKAKQDGFIKKYDAETNCQILQYVDGSISAIDLNERLVKNSSSGFYLRQTFAPLYKVGENFQKGDILAHIPEFFTGKGKNVEYKPGYLAKVAMASGDFCFEDSTIITDDLADDLTTDITMMKGVSIGKNAEILSMVDKGAPIQTGETWLSFIPSYDDPETNEAIASMIAQMPKEEVDEFIAKRYDSRVTGKIIDVKIYFNREIGEYSPSIQNLLKKYIDSVEKRKNLLRKAGVKNVHIPPIERTTELKIGRKEFPLEGGIIIEVYFEHSDVLGPGSKVSFSTALKGIVSYVISKEEAPISEHRPEDHIQAIIASTGILG